MYLTPQTLKPGYGPVTARGKFYDCVPVFCALTSLNIYGLTLIHQLTAGRTFATTLKLRLCGAAATTPLNLVSIQE